MIIVFCFVAEKYVTAFILILTCIYQYIYMHIKGQMSTEEFWLIILMQIFYVQAMTPH